MLEKTFKWAGVAKHATLFKGRYTVRYGNSQRWVDVLHKWYKPVDVVELKYPMTKQQAIQYLLDIDFAGDDVEIQECLLNTLAKNPKASYPNRSKQRDLFAEVDAVLAGAAQEQELDKDLEDAPY